MKSNNDIPKFDLTEQIMVEQRKVASVKRKAPLSKDRRPQTKDQRPKSSLESSFFSLKSNNPCEKIIAEIVARDIKKLRSR